MIEPDTIPAWSRRSGHEVPPLAEELLTMNRFWRRRVSFPVCGPVDGPTHLRPCWQC